MEIAHWSNSKILISVYLCISLIAYSAKTIHKSVKIVDNSLQFLFNIFEITALQTSGSLKSNFPEKFEKESQIELQSDVTRSLLFWWLMQCFCKLSVFEAAIRSIEKKELTYGEQQTWERHAKNAKKMQSPTPTATANDICKWIIFNGG